MRGNRRTKNTFVAVKSRSLTESYAWRVPAANPRFPPTTGHSLAASLATSSPLPTTAGRETRIRDRRWGDRGVTDPPPDSTASMVILPRIVKHAYPCGQVRKLQ